MSIVSLEARIWLFIVFFWQSNIQDTDVRLKIPSENSQRVGDTIRHNDLHCFGHIHSAHKSYVTATGLEPATT